MSRQAGLLLGVVALLCAVHTSPARADDDFLPPDQAFRPSLTAQDGVVSVRYDIASGYYLYRERFHFEVKAGGATLGLPHFPPGQVKYDDTFGKNVETYRGAVTIRIPIENAHGPFDLAVTAQGCADNGICYPPMERLFRISSATRAAAAGKADRNDQAGKALHDDLVDKARDDGRVGKSVHDESAAQTGRDNAGGQPSSGVDRLYSQQYARSVLERRGLPAVLGIFFLLGIALSLLPCSLPMIPILSSIILGEGSAVTRARGFSLSVAYVLGMALVYTALGVAAALAGQGLGAWLQNPWMLGAFAVLLTVFALSLLGCFELQLPAAWQSRVHRASQRYPGGWLMGVFAMGALSALVVGACMTAPLFGVLAFIAHTGNAVLGGAALFVMAWGIGVPLLIVGIGAGALLPRAGGWMYGVKNAFGLLLLAVAVWIVAPVLPGPLALVLWALTLLIGAALLGSFTRYGAGGDGISPWRRIGQALGALCILLALLLTVGAAAGARDPLAPLAVFAARAGAADATAMQPAAGPRFAPVASSAALNQALASTRQAAMLDFYADWCVSCKEMERVTFNDPRVAVRLAQLHLLRADVTANNTDDQLLLKRFTLFGPPAIILFDAAGHERLRVVGYQPPETFLRSLDSASG